MSLLARLPGVLVPMMQVRHVRVGVHDGLVRVRVRMTNPRRQTWMDMGVVPVVVPMAMRV